MPLSNRETKGPQVLTHDLHLAIHLIHLLFTDTSSEVVSVKGCEEAICKEGKKRYDAKLRENWSEESVVTNSNWKIFGLNHGQSVRMRSGGQ